MNRNKGKITLSLAIAATLTLTSVPVFADTNTENSLHETSITKNVSTQGEHTSPNQEPVVNQPLIMGVNGGDTTTGAALEIKSVTLNPDVAVKTNYVEGQPLQSDLKLDVTYTDDSKGQIPVTSDMFHVTKNGATSEGQFNTSEVGYKLVAIFSPNENDELVQRWSNGIIVYGKAENVASTELRISNAEIAKDSTFTPEGVLHVDYNATVDNYTTDYPLTDAKLTINTSQVNTAVPGQYQVPYTFGLKSGIAYVQVVGSPGEKYVTDVELAGIKTDYVQEQDFIPQGVFKVTYSDATTEDVPVTSQNLQYLSTNVIGNNIEARVTYAGRILSYNINVVAKSVNAIEVDQDSPLRTTYTAGTPLTTTGAQINVLWDNDKITKAPLTTDMVTGYNPDQLGQQTLTVTHESKTTTFNVNVIEAPAKIEPVSVRLINPQTEYYKGQQLTVYNAVVTYNDGNMEDVLILPAGASGYDPDVLGTQEVTFSYTSDDGVTVTTEIDIIVFQDIVTGFDLPFNHKFQMKVNEFVPQQVNVIYASGERELVTLQQENFTQLNLSTLGTYTAYLQYGNAGQYVQVEVTSDQKMFADFDPAYGYVPGDGDNIGYVVEYGDELWAPVVFTDGTKGRLPLTEFQLSNVFGELGPKNPQQVWAKMTKDGKTLYARIDKSIAHDRIVSVIQGQELYTQVGEDAVRFTPSAVLVLQLTNGEEVLIGTDSIMPINLGTADQQLPTGKTGKDYFGKRYSFPLTIGTHNVELTTVITDDFELSGKPTTREMQSISLKGFTTSYKIGDKFDGKGAITVHYSDDYLDLLSPTEKSVVMTGFDTATAGVKTVTVTYSHKTATFQINVTAANSGGGSSSGGSGGGTSSGGSGGGGGGATTPAKPAEPAKQAEQANKPAIPGTTQLSRGDIKITKFDKVDAENIKQITGFLIPSNKIEAGLTLPEGMKAVKVEGTVKNFKDVKNHWAADSINRAVELGLLNGMTTDSYAPKASLTAEQTFAGLSNVLMKHDILNLKMDKAKVQEKLAGQLANQTWSTLATAQVLGNTNEAMLSKYADPKAVKEIVTRGEMANIIFALAGDVFPTDAKTAEEFCKETGIMVGDANGNFAANRVLSRAELASILLRVDDKISEL